MYVCLSSSSLEKTKRNAIYSEGLFQAPDKPRLRVQH